MKRLYTFLILLFTAVAIGAPVKIVDLPAITNAQLGTEDVMPIVDITQDATKKISILEIDKRYASLNLSNGNILVGNASGTATSVTMSGDASIVSSGTLTIAGGAITNSKISSSAAINFSKMEDLTASRVLISNASGDVSPASVTSSTLAYVDFTSSGQTQLDSKVSLTGDQTVAGVKTLSSYINLTSGQIKFPATQNASSDPTVFDDYEEGNCTLTYTASVSNPTVSYTNQKCIYTKSARTVNLTSRLTISSLSGGSGNLQISGLPFATLNDAQVFGACYVVFKEGWTTNGPQTMRMIPNSSIINSLSTPTATGITDLTISNLSSSADVIFKCIYESAN